MRRLIDYITETKIGNLGLTRDDLSDYVDTAVLISGKIKDYTAYNKIERVFADRFGKKQGEAIFRSFRRYVEFFIDTIARYTDVTDSIIQLLYDKLESVDARKIVNMLGTGCEATTVDLGDNKVIKLYFNNKVPLDRISFFEMCKNKVCKHFPIVYRVGKGYVVMEKVKTETKHCEDIYNALFHKRNGYLLYHLIQDGKTNDTKYNFSPIELEAIQFMKEIRPFLDIIGYDSTYYGDLSIDNIGEREDGTIVYFDI